MRATRARQVTGLLLGAAALVLGVWVYVARQDLAEAWHLLALRHARTALAKRDALQSLARVGSRRTVEPCVAALDDNELRAAAAGTLASVAPRLASRERQELVSKLVVRGLGRSYSGPPGKEFEAEVLLALHEIAQRNLDALRAVLAVRGHQSFALWKVAALAALERYASTPAEVVALLRELSAEELVAFFRVPCLLRQKRSLLGNPRELPDPPWDGALSLAGQLAPGHPDPQARAVLLSFQVCRDRQQYDPSPAAAAYRDDPSPLVKVAALRIAGCLGQRTDTIDLGRAVLEEEDAGRLTAAVEARSLWATGGWQAGGGIELYPGLIGSWISVGRLDQERQKAWTQEELARLEAILATRREPPLRDAASHALASRYRNNWNLRSSPPEPFRVPGFRVAEWGVWIDTGGRLEPPTKHLDDLPAFVHRSQVASAEYFGERFYSQSIVTKPVVFFHAPRPLSVLFEVDFHGGRPWTYYPAATDLSHTTIGHDFATAAGGAPSSSGNSAPLASALPGSGGGRPSPGATPPLIETTAVDPPWIPLQGNAGAPRSHWYFHPFARDLVEPERPESLRPFYASVPWVRPLSPRSPTATGGGGRGPRQHRSRVVRPSRRLRGRARGAGARRRGLPLVAVRARGGGIAGRRAG